MRHGVPEVQRAGGGDSVSQHAAIVPWAIAGIAFRNAMLVLYGGQRKCIGAWRIGCLWQAQNRIGFWLRKYISRTFPRSCQSPFTPQKNSRFYVTS